MTDSVFNIHIETENGNYEWGASQVLVLLSNYYSNKKLFDENRDGYGNILILKDASIISKSSTTRFITLLELYKSKYYWRRYSISYETNFIRVKR